MGRPTDWSPLAGSDPVPGDPAGISAEAAHLSSVAEQIESQVAVLRKIASGQSDEKGQHADKLQAAASDTADHLEKVIGRYRETAAALNAWVPELEYAQAQSLKALSQAQEAHGRQRASQPIQRPPGAHLTAADHQEDQARGRMLAQANADMSSAQAMLAAAVSHRDTAAAQTASKIRSAIGQDADHWYDGITGALSSAWDWVSDHWVPLLKDLCTALEVVAAVLALVALFIPGLDIIAVLALITLAAVIGRGVLAATGNGSWLDFGLDVLALATLGLGAGAFGAARAFFGASKAVETAATSADEIGKGLVEGERAAKAAEYMTKFFGATRGRLIGEGKASELAMKWAAEKIPDLATEGEKASYWGKVWHGVKAGGSIDDYDNFAKLSRIAERYGSDPDIADAMSRGSHALTALRAAAVANWGGAISSIVGGGAEIDNPMNGHEVFRWHNWFSGGWDRLEHWRYVNGAIPGLATGGGG